MFCVNKCPLFFKEVFISYLVYAFFCSTSHLRSIFLVSDKKGPMNNVNQRVESLLFTWLSYTQFSGIHNFNISGFPLG